MSLPGVIFGIVPHLLLAIGLFVLAVIAGSGLASRRVLSRPQVALLDLSLYLLPLSCGAGAGLALVAYRTGANADGYVWYSLPGITLAAYVGLTLTIGARAPRHRSTAGSRGPAPESPAAHTLAYRHARLPVCGIMRSGASHHAPRGLHAPPDEHTRSHDQSGPERS